MTKALSSLSFEKGATRLEVLFSEGKVPFHSILIYQNRIELSSSHLFAQQENSEWLWRGDYATFNVEFVSVTAE